MAGRTLKRYGLEESAKMLIAVGLIFNLFSWLVAAHYVGAGYKLTLFIVPFTFTCVSILILIAIRYRYVLFEKYPYLVNLPSIFYRIGEGKNGKNKQSIAFSMIFTVHTLVLAVMGLMSLLLTFSISSRSPSFLILYLAAVAILIVAVLLQYRRIYLKLSK